MVRTQLAKLHFSGEVRAAREIQAWTDPRCAALRLLSDQLNQRHIPGAAAEFGVYKGEFAKEINHCFPDRELYLFDSFTGFCAEDIWQSKKWAFPSRPTGFFRYHPVPGPL
jgi:O-methyltransferase